jgi:aspartyl-tRNA(Asn)/glutamyl-tRNA(Gln) amidotransferase subunit C
MKVTEKEVDYVADLASLELTPEERTRMVRDLNSILEYVDTLGELDTANVAPMAQVMAPGITELGYARREDTLKPSLPHDDAMRNSPAPHPDFFKVPKVIER